MYSNRYLNKRVTKYYLKIFLLYLYLFSSFSVHIFVEIWNVSNQLICSLEYNCFTVLCWFLLYNKVKPPYVYIYPLPPPNPRHPTHLSCHGAPAGASCATAGSHQLPVLPLVVCVCQSNLPISSTFLFPHCVHMFVHNCVSIPALQRGSSVSFFLDSTYMH